ncbi:Nramp family divalent metal transporter [Microbispora hainanensis]|uniref:Nramp family divalent metal transporter n=1 Tax=Microbispora hainanensis TaxID=568844 RepID=UPI0033DB7FD9
MLRATRLDVLTAMGLAGMVNAAILAIGAAALSPAVGASLEGAYRGLAAGLGQVPAAFFALALLASGLAATSVGTYAGTVIAEGFLGRWSSLSMRRLATLVPAMAVLAAGAEPGRVLVISQVVLSFGIPFALWPLVMFTHRRDLMGRLVNRPVTPVCAAACASAVTVLNCALVWYETAG